MLPLLPLAFVPLSAALHYMWGASPLWVFATASVGVMALAYHISNATEALAETAGPAIGGLLNVSFGSVAELVLAIFVLAEGQADVVRAQIKGSIIGTVLGAFVIGFLSDGLVLVGVSAFWQLVVKGAVIILAVILEQTQERLKTRLAA